jgi:CelD/BcsL family acetyltransferase involved in cellulose biosynthesis
MAATLQSETIDSKTRIEWVHEPERLAALAEAWRALEADPFTSPDWFLPWWDAFGDGRDLATCLAWRGSELVGVAPMIAHGHALEAMVNDHTPYFELAAQDVEARTAILSAMSASPYTCVALNALPALGPTAAALPAHSDTRRTVTRPRYRSPIVDTSVGLEAFRAASKPRWGAPLERFRRKMAREHQATLQLVEHPEHLDSVLDLGFAVEASGWKGARGTAIVSKPETEHFYRSVAHAFAARGQFAVSSISFGGEMVAFDLCLLAGERLYLLKTGFDERHRRLAPGLVLRLAVIERCIETSISAHELLGEDSEWKRKFADSAREHIEIRTYRSGPRGTAGWAYRRYARPVLRQAYSRARRSRSRQ